MIMPSDLDIKKDSVKVMAKKFESVGYDASGALYLAKKLKGVIKDNEDLS